MENQNLTPFEGQNIRRIEHEGEMWFSVVDIIGILTESTAPNKYLSALKKREPQLSTICRKLKFRSESDGKMYPTDCANTEGVLRIIQSVPSPKAEPFKMWLAGLGKQAIDEVNDPEILTERQAEIYRAKGYPESWITRRVKTIDIRKELTDEWKKRGVSEGQEYSILTATIAKATFGVTPSEHAKIKGLDKQNLRDHMTNIELVLTALSEETTRAIAVNNDAQGFNENQDAAMKGGDVAGQARLNYEEATQTKVLSEKNFLDLKGDNSDMTQELPKPINH
jgi:DNA-damage-inducible protein D